MPSFDINYANYGLNAFLSGPACVGPAGIDGSWGLLALTAIREAIELRRWEVANEQILVVADQLEAARFRVPATCFVAKAR